MYSGGYAGRILRINLSHKTTKEERLPVEMARDFIGGAAGRIYRLYTAPFYASNNQPCLSATVGGTRPNHQL